MAAQRTENARASGRPRLLGGYRIVKSYYEHAENKHQAPLDIFKMKDPKAFLAKSGWHPAAPQQSAVAFWM
jgi:hypothetical protein